MSDSLLVFLAAIGGSLATLFIQYSVSVTQSRVARRAAITTEVADLVELHLRVARELRARGDKSAEIEESLKDAQTEVRLRCEKDVVDALDRAVRSTTPGDSTIKAYEERAAAELVEKRLSSNLLKLWPIERR